MLAKTSKPVIEVLTGSLVSGIPRSQAESKIQSPRGLKNLHLGGVGLGIVAALEKSGDGSGIPALFGRNLTRSSPIPVNSPKNSWRSRRAAEEVEEAEMDSLEEYTIVTCHGANKSYTKVYSGDGGRKGGDRAPFRIPKSNRTAAVFHISPERYAAASVAPAADFLSSCDLCGKKLHGKDVYMYRGEKAFCSSECRYRQMVVDERKEKCGAEAASTAAAEVAGSPYANGQMLATGIFAI